MAKLIKRGGFREQAARQLKYKNSVNQRTNISAQKVYPPSHHNEEGVQDNIAQENLVQPDPAPKDTMDNVHSNSIIEDDATPKNT